MNTRDLFIVVMVSATILLLTLHKKMLVKKMPRKSKAEYRLEKAIYIVLSDGIARTKIALKKEVDNILGADTDYIFFRECLERLVKNKTIEECSVYVENDRRRRVIVRGSPFKPGKTFFYSSKYAVLEWQGFRSTK